MSSTTKVTTLKEKLIPVHGTTKLHIYDGGYPQPGTNLEFHGSISAAPLGLMRIRLDHIESDELDWDQYEVSVFQASREEVLAVYNSGKFFPSEVKKFCEVLNCERASYDIETKFGSDHFGTGGDGGYGTLKQMKQHYGMILHLWFDDDLFTFEELEERFLRLWKERRVDEATRKILGIKEEEAA